MKRVIILLLLFSSSILGKSQNADAFMIKCQTFIKNEQYQQAIDYCNKYLQTYNTSSIIYMNRGVAFFKLNQYDKSQRDLDSAIILDRKNYEAFFNRGCLFQKLSMNNKALNDYNICIKLNINFLYISVIIPSIN